MENIINIKKFVTDRINISNHLLDKDKMIELWKLIDAGVTVNTNLTQDNISDMGFKLTDHNTQLSEDEIIGFGFIKSYTDTNTWRDVYDNLDSSDGEISLSANQGRVLKDLVDNHNHDGDYTGDQDLSGLMPKQFATTYRIIPSGGWSDYNLGNGTMSQHGSVGKPSGATNGYWFNLGRRDSGGGYVGMYVSNYQSGGSGVYIGRAELTDDNPTWEQVWTSKTDGSGSGLDADKLDGKHGGDFVDLTSTQTVGGDKIFSNNIQVGTRSTNENTKITVYSNDAHNSGFEAMGNSQGTGYTYVGQSSTHGGGMFYNGDASPEFADGDDADRISFYRREAGNNTVVFSYSCSNNDVTFRGNIYSVGGSVSATDGNFSGNVGIGTSSLDSKLTIGGNAITTLKPTAIISDETNGGSLTLRGQSPILSFDGSAGGVGKILMDNAGLEFKTGHLDDEGDVAFILKDDNSAEFALNGTFNGFLDVTQVVTGIKSSYSTVAVQSTDAHLDLISSEAGSWGSSLNLIEGDSDNNTNVNIWSIARRTSGGGNNLHFNYGTNNSHDNNTKFIIESQGNVGLDTETPISKLEVSQQLSEAQTIDYIQTLSSRDDDNSINQSGGEGVGIKFRIAGNDAANPGNSLTAAGIAAVRESPSDGNSDAGLHFFVNDGDETLDLALKLNSDKSAIFEHKVTSKGRLTVENSVGGDGGAVEGIHIKNTSDNTGESSLYFSNTGASGTGSNYWFTGLNQNASYKIAYGTGFTGPFTKLELDASGNFLVTGNASAANLSGTNTGDQTLPTASSLGVVTLAGAQTITGQKTFDTGSYNPLILDRTGNSNVNMSFYHDAVLQGYLGVGVSGGLTWGSNANSEVNYVIYHSGNMNPVSGTNTGDQNLQSVTDKGNATTNALEITSDTLTLIKSETSGVDAGIRLSTQPSVSQYGDITFQHANTASYGSVASIKLSSGESNLTILADGKLMFKEGIYSKPSSGTGAGTRKDTLWDEAYGWGNHADADYLKESGGTMTSPIYFPNDNVVNRSFEMIENASPQYIILCEDAGDNDVNGSIKLDRTSGNHQAANLDILVTSTRDNIEGGSLNTQQVTQNAEEYSLMTITYNSISYVAIKYTGSTYPATHPSTFTGRLVSTGISLNVVSSGVTNEAELPGSTKNVIGADKLQINGTATIASVHAGGELMSSVAQFQVNGFQRTGNIYLHSGGNTPDNVRASDFLSNVGGVLNWTGGAKFNDTVTIEGSDKNLYILNTSESASGIVFGDVQGGASQMAAIKFDSSGGQENLKFFVNDENNEVANFDTTGNLNIINGNVTASNFILSSDRRLKTKIKKVDNKHIDADWKTFEMKSNKGQKRYGVIAQELEVKNPEFVRTDEEGMKSVAYIDLLIAKIAELEARLEKAGI